MKNFLKIFVGLLLCIVVVILGYAVYVFASFNRIEDNLSLTVTASGTKKSAPIGAEIKITSYNIGFGAYNSDYTFFMDGGKESRCRSKEIAIENVTGALNKTKEQNADIMLFQEVDIKGTRSYKVNQFDILQNGLKSNFYSSFAQNYNSPYLYWPLLSPHGANKSGIATFSKYQITSALRRSLPIETGVIKVLDLDRCYSVNRIPTENGKELVIYNVHLSAYTSDGTIATKQLEMLISDMQAEFNKGNYCIAGGDFNKDLPNDSNNTENTWAQPIPNGTIPKELTLIPPKANPLKSCRDTGEVYDKESTFTITVDGFIVSENIEAISSFVIDTGFEFSDHNPVILSFKLK